MEILLIITLMLFATVVIVAISDRFGLPWPVLITLVAASAFFFPSLPLLHIPAEMMLPIFLPPLLWALARRTSWAAIRSQWVTVVSLSVLLVLVSAIAAAGVALWMFFCQLFFPSLHGRRDGTVAVEKHTGGEESAAAESWQTFLRLLHEQSL